MEHHHGHHHHRDNNNSGGLQWAQQRSASLERRHHPQSSSPPPPAAAASYFIDGPGRMTSALQLIVAASTQQRSSSTPPPSSELGSSPRAPASSHPHLSASSSSNSLHHSHQNLQAPPPPAASPAEHAHIKAGPRTIVASDNEVSNGFVKDGKRLPYVFEATESGARKRSSKILPVCGVCGKRFVCVTTMKRHLVTHTGEKPFSCKVCGKMYTQKGNLRVHERTHRNDRPFECNICNQKFYRKEPMQKHQWRQHGIVHFKSRPPLLPGQVEPSSPIPQPPPHPGMTTSNPTLGGIIGTAEGVVFNSIVDRIKNNSIESYHDSSSRGLDRSGPPPPPPPPAAHALAAASMVEDDVEEEDSIHGIDLSAASSRQHPEPRPAHGANQSGSQHAQQQQLEAQHPHHNPSLPQMHHDYLPPSPPQPQEKPVSPPRVEFQPLPSQISNFLLLQQHQEHQEQRDQLRREEQEQEASDDTEPSPNSRLLINLPSSPEDGGRPESPTDHSQLQQQQQQQHPIKMKKMLAHAYQREIEEQRTDSMSSEDDQDQLSNPGGSNSGSEKDLVECQCKSCGNVFAVHDPYNFRCTHCHVKYSSLPTHMIADPLQCIGCCQVFPHKPALKSHQICNEKERPFRCCKCGYRFRQKAHLQKHQWRIHRRKLEPEPSEIQQQQQQQHSQQTSDQQQQLSLRSNNSSSIAKTITIQDIIDHGVERGLGPSSRPHAMDSSSVARFSVRTPSPERHPHGDNAGDRAAGNSLQPLDLSPVKTSSQSSISRGKNEANPSSFSSPSSASSPPSSSSSPYQDDSNQNASLPCLPAWKKPRTSPGPAPPTTAGIGTHRTLPPITPSWLSPTATTTKPMTLMTPDATTATTNEDEDMTPTNLKVKQQGRIDNNATDMVKTNFDTPCRTLDIRNV